MERVRRAWKENVSRHTNVVSIQMNRTVEKKDAPSVVYIHEVFSRSLFSGDLEDVLGVLLEDDFTCRLLDLIQVRTRPRACQKHAYFAGGE